MFWSKSKTVNVFGTDVIIPHTEEDYEAALLRSGLDDIHTKVVKHRRNDERVIYFVLKTGYVIIVDINIDFMDYKYYVKVHYLGQTNELNNTEVILLDKLKDKIENSLGVRKDKEVTEYYDDTSNVYKLTINE